MSIRGRVSKLERSMGVKAAKGKKQHVTKDELLFIDYQEYREKIIAYAIAYYTGQDEKAERIGKEIEHLQETLQPISRPASFSSEKHAELMRKAISDHFDKYPEEVSMPLLEERG